VTELPWLPI